MYKISVYFECDAFFNTSDNYSKLSMHDIYIDNSEREHGQVLFINYRYKFVFYTSEDVLLIYVKD